MNPSTVYQSTTAPRTRLDLEAAFDAAANRHAELCAAEDRILECQDGGRGPLPLDIHFKLDSLRSELAYTERELDTLQAQLQAAS